MNIKTLLLKSLLVSVLGSWQLQAAPIFVPAAMKSDRAVGAIQNLNQSVEPDHARKAFNLLLSWEGSAEVQFKLQYRVKKRLVVDNLANVQRTPLPANQLAVHFYRWKFPDDATDAVLIATRGAQELARENLYVTPNSYAAIEAGHDHAMHHAGHHVSASTASESKAIAKAVAPGNMPLNPTVTCPYGQNDAPPGDAPPMCPKKPASVGDPISLTDGSYWTSVPCFVLGGAGRPITVGLEYDTHKWADNNGYSGIGVGWNISYQRSLQVQLQNSRVLLVMEGGGWTSWSISGTSYVEAAGNRAKLVADGTGFKLTYRNGEKDYYDASGALTKVEDRLGNATLVSGFVVGADQIGRKTLTNNRTQQSLVLEHQEVGGAWKLTRIVESGTGITAPRQMLLDYGTAGNDLGKLVRVTDAAGRKYTYEYDSLGRISKYWDPANDPQSNTAAVPVINEYASPSLHSVDRMAVARQTQGDRQLDITLAYLTLSSDPGTSSYLYRKDVMYKAKKAGVFQNVRTDTYVIGILNSVGRQMIYRQFKPGATVPSSALMASVDTSTIPFQQTLYDAKGNIVREQVASGNPSVKGARTDFGYNASGDLVSIKTYTDTTNDVPSDTSTFAYPTITNINDPANTFGMPTQIVDASGRTTTMSYDAQGLLTALTVSGGGTSQTTNIAYDPVTVNGVGIYAGLATHITMPDQTLVRQEYDSLGYPTITTFDANAGGLAITERTAYNARGDLLSSWDRRGIRTDFEYVQDLAQGKFGSLGVPSAQIYDVGGRNIRTETKYDVMLNPIQVIADAGPGRRNAQTAISYARLDYEANYLPISVLDPEFRSTRYTYTPFGALETITQVANRDGDASYLVDCTGQATIPRTANAERVTRFCYTAEGWLWKTILDDNRVAQTNDYGGFGDGLVRASTDARGVRTAYQYDRKLRLTKVLTGTAGFSEDGVSYPAVNGEYSTTYDASDRVLSMIAKLASGTRTLVTNQYDGLGRLTQSTDGAGNQTRYEYDAARNFLLRAISGANAPANQVVVQNTYDPLGRILTSRTDPNGKNLLTQYRYASTDDRWSLNAMVNPRGLETKYLYNSLGSLQQLVDAAGSTWNYTTNNLGDLLKVDVPGAGADTDYTVNQVGQNLTLARNGQTESWSYNQDGTVNRYTDFSGQTVDGSYDNVGRLIGLNYSGSANDPSGVRSDIDQIQYWPNNLVRAVTSKPNGSVAETTIYRYDALNRLSSATRNGRQVGYAYNLDDTLSQMNYWTRGSVSFAYGANNQNNGLIRSITPFAQAATSYNYLATNQLSAIQRPNNVASNLSYDSAARVLAINHVNQGVLRASAAYELDANGNRTKLTESFGDTTGSAQQSSVHNYRYDVLDRLVRAEYGAIGTTAKREENYQYDAVGNRTNVQQTTTHYTSDFNKDGTTDLFWRNFNNTSGDNGAWYLGGANGDQIQSQLATTAVGPSAWHSRSGDINGDGINELIWRNYSSGQNTFWPMGGAPNNLTYQNNGGDLLTASGTQASAPAEWSMEAVADFNQDGKADMVWRNYNTGQNVIWFMGGGSAGQQMIGDSTLEAVPDVAWRLETAADFNHDGWTDLMWHKPSSGEVAMWFMGRNTDGRGTKVLEKSPVQLNGSNVSVQTTLTGVRIRGVGDFDKDGNPEVVWQNGPATGTNSTSLIIWKMAPDGKTIAGYYNSPLPKPGGDWWVEKGSSYQRITSQVTLSYDASDRVSTAGYSYDTNGNLTASPAMLGQSATSFVYAANNKLMRTVKDGVTTEYQYDGNGNLIRQIRAGVTTDYVLDESSGLASMIGEISGSSETAYAFGPDGLHAQQNWINGAAQGVMYPLNDGLSSMKGLTNASGNLMDLMSYDAWGVKRYGPSSLPKSFGFTGEQSMPDGTTYLRARSYLPALGRFLQRDTFAGFAGRPQSLNRYAYVEGNPANWVDPSGYHAGGPRPTPVPMITVEGPSPYYRDKNGDQQLGLPKRPQDAKSICRDARIVIKVRPLVGNQLGWLKGKTSGQIKQKLRELAAGRDSRYAGVNDETTHTKPFKNYQDAKKLSQQQGYYGSAPHRLAAEAASARTGYKIDASFFMEDDPFLGRAGNNHNYTPNRKHGMFPGATSKIAIAHDTDYGLGYNFGAGPLWQLNDGGQYNGTEGLIPGAGFPVYTSGHPDWEVDYRDCGCGQ